MEVYDFEDYRTYILGKIQSFPNKGRGQLTKLARAMAANSSLLSQVLKGTRDLTEDQAYNVSLFFGHSTSEAFYFLTMVNKSRAAHHKLKKLYQDQLNKLKIESKSLKNRMKSDKDLTFEQQSIYYSNWLYTAIRSLVDIEGNHTEFALSQRLAVPLRVIREVTQFLIDSGLCVLKDDKIMVGPKTTYVPPDSPLVIRHHANWRVKSIERMNHLVDENFFFTAPLSISEQDFGKLRSQIVQWVTEAAKTVEASSPEIAGCLSIDLFRY